MGYKKDDGTWHDTCLDKLKPGEPFFVLRAQDIHASQLVRLWAYMAELSGCPEKKVWEAIQTVSAMEEWPNRKYPD